jgi:hypothetical protein
MEERLLLSSATVPTNQPTDAEQYMLELINMARANPAAMGQYLVNLAHTDPVLQATTQGENLGQFLQEIDSFGPEPPLAFNSGLIQAATAHSQAMLAANSQFHSPLDYLTNPADATGMNGQAYYPVGSSYWSAGENIFAYGGEVNGTGDAGAVNYFESAFLLDWGNPDFGHLTNILAPGPGEWSPGAPHYPYSEIGIGLLTNVTPTVPPPSSSSIAANLGINVGPDIVSQEFGWRSGNPILTGSIYLDWAGAGMYEPGEGYGGVTIRAVGLNGQGVFQTSTWSTGGYSLPLPPGSYAITASGGGIPAPLSTTVTLHTDNVEWEYGFKTAVADQPVPGRYFGNGQTVAAVYRESTGLWFVAGLSQPIRFGAPGTDVPEPSDYDGVGHTEIAVYRPTTAQWFVLGSNGVGRQLAQFGGPGMDVPEPGDYDGVGRTEVAVYRPSTGQWFVLGPNGVGRQLATFGAPNTDVPIPGNYDGVGHAEPAVYRPSTGQWLVLGPNGGHVIATLGTSIDVPVPGDYDGVGHLEPAVYRPSTGQWFILGPNGLRVTSFGVGNLDVPLLGNFDGDRKADLAVYRPSTGYWYIRTSRSGDESFQFGMAGAYMPVAAGPPLALPVSTAPAAIPAAQTTSSLAILTRSVVTSTTTRRVSNLPVSTTSFPRPFSMLAKRRRSR